VKQGGVDKKTGTELYLDVDRIAPNTVNVVMRTALTPGAIGPTVQRIMKTLDPTLPVVRLQGMDEVFDDAIGHPRMHRLWALESGKQGRGERGPFDSLRAPFDR